KPMEDTIVVGFAFMKGALRITGGNTSFRKLHISGSGQRTVEFAFDSNPLATGRYSVIAAVHDARIIECYDIQIDALSFDVVDKADENNFDGDLVSPAVMISDINVSTIGGP